MAFFMSSLSKLRLHLIQEDDANVPWASTNIPAGIPATKTLFRNSIIPEVPFTSSVCLHTSNNTEKSNTFHVKHWKLLKKLSFGKAFETKMNRMHTYSITLFAENILFLHTLQ